MKLFKATVQKSIITIQEKAVRIRERFADDRGGVSPIVVTVGLALLLVAILVAVSPNIRTSITTAITNLFTRLGTL